MTTIAWDGNELVSDSRITDTSVGTGKDSYSDTCRIKIVEGAPFLYKGQQVQAFGFTGSLNALKELISRGQEATKNGQQVELSSFNPDDMLFLTFTALAMCDYDLLVITSQNVATIHSRPAEYKYETAEGDRTMFAMAGSSYVVMIKMINVVKDARAFVTYASIVDNRTGGNYNTWSVDNGLQTNVPRMSKWKAVFKIFAGAYRMNKARRIASKKEALTT